MFGGKGGGGGGRLRGRQVPGVGTLACRRRDEGERAPLLTLDNFRRKREEPTKSLFQLPNKTVFLK